MGWMNKVRQCRPYTLLAWGFGVVLAAGTVAGAINSLVDLFNRGWLANVNNWYTFATGWLGSEVTIPAWSIIVAGAAMVGLATRIRQPDIAPEAPTPNQITVLREILVFYQQEVRATLSNLEFSMGLPKLHIECAMDALAQQGLITWDQDLFESLEYRAELTAKGRDYLLKLQRPLTQ